VGAGQIYNGEVPKGLGMFLVAAVAGGIFGIAACFVIIPLTIYAACDAYSTAGKINKRLEDQAFLKKKDEAEVARIEATTTSVQEFVDGIRKLHNLSTNGLLTTEEFEARKRKAILALAEFPPREGTDDFLTALIPLIKVQALLEGDITEIKALVF